jgi:hypothetical protein
MRFRTPGAFPMDFVFVTGGLALFGLFAVYALLLRRV